MAESKNGVIKSTEDAIRGEEISVILADGRISAVVKDIVKENVFDE